MEHIKEETDDLILVKLDLNVGDKFLSFKEFQEKLDKTARKNFVRFWKRDSRSIQGAKKKVKRFLKPELQFYQLKYACVYGQKPRTRPTLGKRKKRSLVRDRSDPCSASIGLKVAENGEYLEICSLVELHNHPVNEQIYQTIRKKTTTLQELLENDDDGNIVLEVITTEDKYKTVLKKCKHIARIASVSSNSRFGEIMKNLDDFLYYLKYTTPQSQIDQISHENVINNNDSAMVTTQNENIQIIVERVGENDSDN